MRCPAPARAPRVGVAHVAVFAPAEQLEHAGTMLDPLLRNVDDKGQVRIPYLSEWNVEVYWSGRPGPGPSAVGVPLSAPHLRRWASSRPTLPGFGARLCYFASYFWRSSHALTSAACLLPSIPSMTALCVARFALPSTHSTVWRRRCGRSLPPARPCSRSQRALRRPAPRRDP